MNKIEAWKTTDGKVWETEAEANMHERKTEGESLIINIYFHGMLECSNDLVEFLTQYKTTVLKYYELIEK